mmetsp:Transcript_22789/g.37810  ORF Transcript_22789/g.37810 Transcript_22789/m.37810 type:complete len:222 (+) Transcript_22789:371-1036(+)
MPRRKMPLYEDPALGETFDAQAQRFQRHYWDSQAEHWTDHQNQSGLQPAHLDGLQGWFGTPMLLIGSARGLILRKLIEMGYQPTGVDWAQAMVDAARAGGFDDVHQADAADLPFETGRFGCVVIASGVLMPTHAQSRTRAYLQEARRVLHPGGRVVLALCHDAGSIDAKQRAQSVQLAIHTLHAQVFWDLDPLRAVLKTVGLKVIDSADFEGVHIMRLHVE